MELHTAVEQLKVWVARDLGTYSDPAKLLRGLSVQDMSATRIIGERKVTDEWRITLDLWTRRNRFQVVIKHTTGSAIGAYVYMGANATSRSWRAGEDWHRGNDLPDGEFNEANWSRILLAILSYELDEPVAPLSPTALTAPVLENMDPRIVVTPTMEPVSIPARNTGEADAVLHHRHNSGTACAACEILVLRQALAATEGGA